MGEIVEVASKVDNIVFSRVCDSVVDGHAVEDLEDEVLVEEYFVTLDYFGCLLLHLDWFAVVVDYVVIYLVSSFDVLLSFD